MVQNLLDLSSQLFKSREILLLVERAVIVGPIVSTTLKNILCKDLRISKLDSN